jgi:hypothetical protein
MMLSRNRENLYDLSEFMLKEKEKMQGYHIIHEEIIELEKFISKFTILKQN